MTQLTPSTPFAIIETPDTQRLVSVGEVIAFPTMEQKPGTSVTFDKVMLVSGDTMKVGTPYVSGASVTGTVVDHGRTRKITGVKFHNKVRYRRTFGHRQGWTKIKIEKIVG